MSLPPLREIQAANLITAIRQSLTTGTHVEAADGVEAARVLHGATRYEAWRHTLVLAPHVAAVYFIRHDVLNSKGTP